MNNMKNAFLLSLLLLASIANAQDNMRPEVAINSLSNNIKPEKKISNWSIGISLFNWSQAALVPHDSFNLTLTPEFVVSYHHPKRLIMYQLSGAYAKMYNTWAVSNELGNAPQTHSTTNEGQYIKLNFSTRLNRKDLAFNIWTGLALGYSHYSTEYKFTIPGPFFGDYNHIAQLNNRKKLFVEPNIDFNFKISEHFNIATRFRLPFVVAQSQGYSTDQYAPGLGSRTINLRSRHVGTKWFEVFLHYRF
jgi:hypothetical protein